MVLDNYYLVHNYLKISKIIPYNTLKPRGDMKFSAIENFVNNYIYWNYHNFEINNTKDYYIEALNNYKEYYNCLTFDNNLPPAQSNIGIYFKLVPKHIVDSDKYVEINEKTNNFSYIFDANKLIDYIINDNNFINNYLIPKIYWSPNNYYGHLDVSSTIIGLYKEDFIKKMMKNMIYPFTKTHEIVSLVSIDITDKKSGFLGFKNSTFM